MRLAGVEFAEIESLLCKLGTSFPVLQVIVVLLFWLRNPGIMCGTPCHQIAFHRSLYCALSGCLLQPMKLVNVCRLYACITAVTNALSESTLPNVKLVLAERAVVRVVMWY